MAKGDYESEFQRRLGIGTAFEQFIVFVFRQMGKEIRIYKTADQFRIGETECGMEIKFDSYHMKTRRIFFEIEERQKDKDTFIPSGIYRPDNSITYLIGDYYRVYLFEKKHLQKVHRGEWPGIPKPEVIEINSTQANGKKRLTGRGFFITHADIDRSNIPHTIIQTMDFVDDYRKHLTEGGN